MEIPTLVRRLSALAFGWARPAWKSDTALTEAAWKSQHDEISKTVWNLGSLLAGSCVFCVLILSAPDVDLISNDARITVPIVSLSVSYTDFLLFGPVFLIVLTLYLHVFVEQRIRLGVSRPPPSSPSSEPLSPFLFNLGLPSADLLSSFLFYGMSPAVLALFVWKTIPRPDAPWLLMSAFVATSALMLALHIRRFGAERTRPSTPSRLGLGILWTLFGACLFALVLLAPIAGRIVFGATTSSRANSGPSEKPGSGLRDSMLLRIRRLQLFGAVLAKKNLTGFYAPYADLRKSDFRETDLNGANLFHADLREANLAGANLTGADLRKARLEGAVLTGAKLSGADLREVSLAESTQIDVKWRWVTCVLNRDITRDCLKRPDLTWTDLSGANLGESNLKGVQLTGADLSYADLSRTDLTGAILRVADLRHALLPSSIRNAATDGTLVTGQHDSATDLGDARVFLVNHTTEACVEAPRVPDDRSRPLMTYPCAQTNEGRQKWSVKRLANGHFMFKAPSSGGEGQSACLDGTSDNNEWAPIQLWQCNEDYDNQYWRITPVSDGYVSIAKDKTSLCLDGTGRREGTRVPFLSTCNSEKHDQQWRISLSPPPVSAVVHVKESPESLRLERALDLERAARQYNVSPAGRESASGRPYEFGGYARRRVSPSGRPGPGR